MALAPVVPLLSPLLPALVVGAVVANSPLMGVRAVVDHGPATRLLLRLGVAAPGLQLPFGDIVGIGPVGLVVIVTTVAVTFRTTLAVGRRLGLGRGLRRAAVGRLLDLRSGRHRRCPGLGAGQGEVRRARRRHGDDLRLRDDRPRAMAGRGHRPDRSPSRDLGRREHPRGRPGGRRGVTDRRIGRRSRDDRQARPGGAARPDLRALAKGAKGTSAPLVPWFIVAFAIAVAVRSTGLLPAPVLEGTNLATTLLPAAGMYGLGMGIRARDLWPLPVQGAHPGDRLDARGRRDLARARHDTGVTSAAPAGRRGTGTAPAVTREVNQIHPMSHGRRRDTGQVAGTLSATSTLRAVRRAAERDRTTATALMT
uniref:Sulfate exporter family transporter n=1 Tax=Janibacter limosus TaxID=53458 RepID=A0AC61U8A2_9MICO|nr:putative sulfate exporter family transporter [Janibacter limosus]